MRINKFIFLILIINSFIIISCKSYKVLESIEWKYKGEIEILNEEKITFKFKLEIDSLKIIGLKLYTNSGFKLGDFLIFNDSIVINKLYNNSFKESIFSVYNKMCSEIFINNLIVYLANNKLFDGNVEVSKSSNCNSSINIEKKEITILSRECKEVCKISKMNNSNKNIKYEIILPKKTKVELTIRKD